MSTMPFSMITATPTSSRRASITGSMTDISRLTMLTLRSPDPQAIGGLDVTLCLSLLEQRTLRRLLALRMILETLLMILMISGDRVRICWILLKTSVDVVLWQKNIYLIFV